MIASRMKTALRWIATVHSLAVVSRSGTSYAIEIGEVGVDGIVQPFTADEIFHIGVKSSYAASTTSAGTKDGSAKNDGPTYNILEENKEEDEEDPLCPIIDSTNFGEGEDLQKTLNIHLVPHTHDDVGWLKTLDQYYYGLNNTIYNASVKLILDSVLDELLDTTTTHNRTFTYVETAFFSKWYTSLSQPRRQSLKKLISQKQFTFANGGWCMHDEATTHFIGMIDQTTLGHSFLKQELGVIPKVGWQLDPFGHSATQASLMTSGFGFDALYFGRMHYVDLENRREAAQVEGLWSPSAKEEESVFWGLTGSYSGNYGPPPNFCFGHFPWCNDTSLMGLSKGDLQARVEDFFSLMGKYANQTKGRNMMLTMGSDFEYQDARKHFLNMDFLIDASNNYLEDGGATKVKEIFGDRFDKVQMFYSTPERYTKCKHADLMNAKQRHELQTIVKGDSFQQGALPTEYVKFDPLSWDIKTSDFFPYADCQHCYWAGYFSSRQGLKRLERFGSSFLHASRQIESKAKLDLISSRNKVNEEKSSMLGKKRKYSNLWRSSPLYTLEDAMGVAQHHDAVAGTSKQHVAYDYAKRIADGISDASSYVVTCLRKLLLDSSSSETGLLKNLSYCHLMNETVCDISQALSTEDGMAIYVVVYNALASQRSEVISLPVDSDASYVVEHLGSLHDWVIVKSTLIENKNNARVAGAAHFTLYFEANFLPPLGASVFRIMRLDNNSDRPYLITRDSNTHLKSNDFSLSTESGHLRANQNQKGVQSQQDEIVISNNLLSVSFDSITGTIKQMSKPLGVGASVEISQEYGFYKSFSSGEQKSGAYVFRPIDESLHVLPAAANITVYESDVVTEVHAEFGEPAWVKQISRLFAGKDYLEVEYVVGPVPINDGVGKEVVSRFSTSISNNGTFFTDSNARQFMKRSKRKRNIFGDDPDHDLDPVAGSYYPVNAAIYIEDEHQSFSVLVDRSQGGTSSSSGAIELMIQRRILHDDNRGVNEPLNETVSGITPYPPFGNATRLGQGVIVKGSHRLGIGPGMTGAELARGQMDRVFSPPHVFVASSPATVHIPFQTASLAGLSNPLPQNTMIITLATTEQGNTFLLRLGHQYDTGESESLSAPAYVDLRDVFPDRTIVSVTEKTLSGNQDRRSWERKQVRWSTAAQSELAQVSRKLEDGANVVMLRPLEVRTFEVQLQ